jgi:hypothetical protein
MKTHLAASGAGSGGYGIVRSVNTVMGDFLAGAEALLAARLERVSLDDIARPAQSNRLHPQYGAHYHG